jgi:hypothetical protein
LRWVALAKTEREFSRILFEAVDEGLLVLGESGRKAVYFHLQNLYSIKREDIPDKLEIFVESLRKIFGVGAEVIERAMARSLYGKLGLNYKEKKGCGFMAYLNDANDATEQELK